MMNTTPNQEQQSATSTPSLTIPEQTMPAAMTNNNISTNISTEIMATRPTEDYATTQSEVQCNNMTRPNTKENIRAAQNLANRFHPQPTTPPTHRSHHFATKPSRLFGGGDDDDHDDDNTSIFQDIDDMLSLQPPPPPKPETPTMTASPFFRTPVISSHHHSPSSMHRPCPQQVDGRFNMATPAVAPGLKASDDDVRVDMDTPNKNMNEVNDREDEDDKDAYMDTPTGEVNSNDDGQEEEEEEETLLNSRQQQMRSRREVEEEQSIALARMLMAQEAMASYQRSQDFLMTNAASYSQEDLQALQAVMQEEEDELAAHGDGLMDDDEDDADDDDGRPRNRNNNHNYDIMLQLGEAIGDVKQERWQQQADQHIQQMETFVFAPSMLNDSIGEQDTRRKCQVCQCDYEEGDVVKRMPLCGCCFHSECVDPWLKNHDNCAYCRKSIVKDEEEEEKNDSNESGTPE